MAITATHGEIKFGVGDKVRVTQRVEEGSKSRNQIFEGMVIAIRGSGSGKSFIVRKIGEAMVGIERIFPLTSPTIVSISVVKPGGKGIRRAKLYFTRTKSKKELDKIYSRTTNKK